MNPWINPKRTGGGGGLDSSPPRPSRAIISRNLFPLPRAFMTCVFQVLRNFMPVLTDRLGVRFKSYATLCNRASAQNLNIFWISVQNIWKMATCAIRLHFELSRLQYCTSWNFAVVILPSRISRVKPSRKFPLQFVSIDGIDNISKVREINHSRITAHGQNRENNCTRKYWRTPVFAFITVKITAIVNSDVQYSQFQRKNNKLHKSQKRRNT